VVNWNGSPASNNTSERDTADCGNLSGGHCLPGNRCGGHSDYRIRKQPRDEFQLPQVSVMALPSGSTFPAPVINSISPSNAAVETLTGPPVALTVNGSGFSPCSVVQWNGAPCRQTYSLDLTGIAGSNPCGQYHGYGKEPSFGDHSHTGGGGTSGNEAFTVYSPGTASSPRIAGGTLSLPLMSSNQRYAVFVQAFCQRQHRKLQERRKIFLWTTLARAPLVARPP